MPREVTIAHPLVNAENLEPVLAPTESARDSHDHRLGLDWRQIVGGVLIVAGFAAVVGAWVGVSGSGANTADQLSYITSGGLGGAGFIAIGVLFFVAHEHYRDREAMSHVAERLERLEALVENGGRN